MSLGAGIFAFCSDTLSVGSRVYPLLLPQKAVLPAISYQLLPGEGPLHSHSSAQSGEGAGESFERVRVQFAVWARSHGEVDRVARELQDAIDGFRGTWGALSVGSCLIESTLDDYEPDTLLYRRIVDALIQYTGGPDGS